MINRPAAGEAAPKAMGDKEQFDWFLAAGNFGAGDRGRTGDVQLGKLAFYH